MWVISSLKRNKKVVYSGAAGEEFDFTRPEGADEGEAGMYVASDGEV